MRRGRCNKSIWHNTTNAKLYCFDIYFNILRRSLCLNTFNTTTVWHFGLCQECAASTTSIAGEYQPFGAADGVEPRGWEEVVSCWFHTCCSWLSCYVLGRDQCQTLYPFEKYNTVSQCFRQTLKNLFSLQSSREGRLNIEDWSFVEYNSDVSLPGFKCSFQHLTANREILNQKQRLRVRARCMRCNVDVCASRPVCSEGDKRSFGRGLIEVAKGQFWGKTIREGWMLIELISTFVCLFVFYESCDFSPTTN